MYKASSAWNCLLELVNCLSHKLLRSCSTFQKFGPTSAGAQTVLLKTKWPLPALPFQLASLHPEKLQSASVCHIQCYPLLISGLGAACRYWWISPRAFKCSLCCGFRQNQSLVDFEIIQTKSIMNCNCGICGLRCLPMPSSPCFATTAATAVAAAAALSDTTGNFQLLEVLFLIYFIIFHVFSCYTMKIIWSSNPLIQVSIQHFTRCDLSINRDSDPVPACPFRSNTRASLASDWTKEVGCGSGSSVRPWEDWQPSKGPVKPSSCWESMPSGDACWTRFGPSPDDANLQVSYCISIRTMNNL